MVNSRYSLWPQSWRAAVRSKDDGSSDETDPRTLTDEILVRRVGRGDETALTELIARYERRLSQFVRWSLADAADMADDVLQEVFLQLHRSAARFGGESSFRTWLYALARNVCRHECRKLRHQPVWIAEGEHTLSAVVDARLSPLDSLTREETIATVRRAVEALPPPYRIVLMLRDWEELSYAEIAEVLEIPVGTVRSRLHNARALLSHRLSEGDLA